MITSTLIKPDGTIETGSSELIDIWRRESEDTLWIDFEFDSPEQVISLLQKFDAHPLAIEDAMRTRHPPKIEFFDNQMFIVYRGVQSSDGSLDFKHQQISFFIEENLLISIHPNPSIGVAKTTANLKTMKMLTPLNITISIMRNSSQVYLDTVIAFDSHLSDLEDELQEQGDDRLLSQLTRYKSRLVKLIRTFNYHLSISQALINEAESYPYIEAEDYAHALRDLNDRFDRLLTLSQMHYNISGDLINGYLSISSHQLNVTMRVLTVITAIFIPLSFLAGLYGMNFHYMPELDFRYGYFFLLGSMLGIAVLLLLFFKKKRWL